MIYELPCGCKFKQFDTTIKADGLPPIEIDFYSLPSCKLVWDMLGEGYSKGVFQLEKGLGKKWVKELKPESIDDLSALAAIIRPGTLNNIVNNKSLTQKYVDRKNGKEEATPFHESLKILLEDTFQILVYQEQTIKIACEIAGFTAGEADGLRKGIGTKDSKIIQGLKTPFLDGCKRVGKIDDKSAEELFGFIEKSSQYSFNKCLSPTSLVTTPKGVQQLSSIKPGDMVFTPYGFINVLNIYNQGKQRLFNVTFENGSSIKCTLNHKFQTKEGVFTLWYTVWKNLGIENIDKSYYNVISIEYLGELDSMDIEIDHPLHIFYANGIATSNSHSVSYGDLGYLTAYCKAHFPTLFFTSYLQHAEDKLDKQAEIRELIDDMKHFSIGIAPPRLTNKIIDNYGKFWVTEENIQFGLASIKGLGKSKINQLYSSVKEKTEKLKKDVKDFTWIEFLCEICPLNQKTVVNNLIYTGATPDKSVSRKRKAFEYKIYLDLTDRDLLWINSNYSKNFCETLKNYSIIERSNGGPATQKKRDSLLEYIKTLDSPAYDLHDSLEWIVNNEKEYLGTSISYNIMDTKNIHSEYTCSDFLLGKRGNINIACEIISIKETVVKNGTSKGQKMAFVGIRDNTGSVDAVIFSEAYSKNKPYLFEGNTIICSGQKTNQGSLSINKVSQI